MLTLLNKQFFTDDVSPLLKLALPLVATGIIESSIGFFSTIFLAKLGPQELAAGALVGWLFGTMMVVLWGTLTAVSVCIAQKHGAKDHLAVSKILRDGLTLSLLLAPPTALLLWFIAPVFLVLGQPETQVMLAQPYFRALVWGILPDFIWLVLLQFLIGIGHTRTSMTCMLLWVPIAIFCNYILIFGKFGAPALGIAGIGWGMTVSYWLTTGWLIAYLMINKNYKSYLYDAFTRAKPFYLIELIQIGVPMGAMYSIEVGFFLALSLIMGLFGEAPLAGNQIALQYLGTLMAVVFSIASAVTVRMGHKIGENNFVAATRASHAGVFLSLCFMSFLLVIYWSFPEWLISIDLDVNDPKNAAIIPFAKQFLAVCAIFQLFEAIRITLFGSLRALKDTHFTLITSIISFWMIALPVGYTLTYTRLGEQGLWWGMVLGAFSSTLLLKSRLKVKMRQHHTAKL